MASVIVLNYNGKRFLDACLDALAAQRLPGGCEVLLVDNGSQDGSVEHVRDRHGWVRVLEIGRNVADFGRVGEPVRPEPDPAQLGVAES